MGNLETSANSPHAMRLGKGIMKTWGNLAFKFCLLTCVAFSANLWGQAASNQPGTGPDQINPKFIVSDKTGTLTTNELVLDGIYENDKSNNIRLLYNVLACTELTTHSITNELLKNDEIEEKLLSYLLKETKYTLLKNDVNEIHIKHNNSIEIIQRLFYKPFDYNLGVKLSVVKIDNELELHIQGTPESVNLYSKNGLDNIFNNINLKETPDNAYKRIIAHAYTKINIEDMENIDNILKDERKFNPRCYIFYDYVVNGVKETVKKVLSKNKHFVMLTGDKESSAIEIGKTIDIINDDCKPYVLNTMKDIDDLFEKINNIKNDYCCVINGRLLDLLISTHYISKLNIIINKWTKHIIFRTTPNGKQLFIKFLQNYNHEVMMIGDGSNDIGALMQSDIGVCVQNNNNNNVQKVSQILISSWNRVSELLYIFPYAKSIMNNVVALSLMKYMQSSFILISMLIVSEFKQMKDPANVILTQLLNASVFVIIYTYVIFAKFNDNHKQLSIMNTIIKGGVLGFVNGLIVFKSIDYYNDGINILMCIQIYQLIMMLSTISKKFEKSNNIKMTIINNLELFIYYTVGFLWIVIVRYITHVSYFKYVSVLCFGIISEVII